MTLACAGPICLLGNKISLGRDVLKGPFFAWTLCVVGLDVGMLRVVGLDAGLVCVVAFDVGVFVLGGWAAINQTLKPSAQHINHQGLPFRSNAI